MGWGPFPHFQCFAVTVCQFFFDNVRIKCIVKTRGDLQGVFVKIGQVIIFKGFSCEIPREQALLRKSKAPRKTPEKRTFLSLAFNNAPSLHTADFSDPTKQRM